MELIPPKEIAGRIMTLLDEARERVVIVSPYNDVAEWAKLVRCLRAVQQRDVPLRYVARGGRKGPENVAELARVGITPDLVPGLHAKLYFNEKRAIVTSMNLMLASDDYSLDVGHITTTPEEYRAVVEFFETQIDPATQTPRKMGRRMEEASGGLIERDIVAGLEARYPGISARYRGDDGQVRIDIGGRTVFMEVVAEETWSGLKLVGILPSALYEYFAGRKPPAMPAQSVSWRLNYGGDGVYDTFHVTVSFAGPQAFWYSDRLRREAARLAIEALGAVFDEIRGAPDPAIARHFDG